jgi:hypothetical protein
MPTGFVFDFIVLFRSDACKCGNISAIESEPPADFAGCL